MRYQKGDGFLGRFISGSVLPIIKKVLPFLGKTALSTGIDILGDVSSGMKVKESAKRRLREAGEKVGEKARAKIEQLTGSGKKRRKRAPAKKTAKKRKPAKRVPSKRKKLRRACDFL